MKTVNISTQKEKRVREPSRGLRTQIKNDLKCILGACTHAPTSRTCLYWNKVVDAEDPAEIQFKLISKIIENEMKRK